jgi:hypothetical protein
VADFFEAGDSNLHLISRESLIFGSKRARLNAPTLRESSKSG